MFIFFAGTRSKILGKETRKINKNGFQVNAEITIIQNYIHLFWFITIPIGKSYTLYIPHSDEYYETGAFSKMPEEYLEICKEVGRSY